MESVTCAPNKASADLWCDAPAVAPHDAVGVTRIRITEGTPLRFGGTRICTVGALATDGAGTTWAISADQCATAAGGDVTTVDGVKIGTVAAVLTNPNRVATDAATKWTLPAIKLSAAALADPTIKGTGSAAEGATVTLRGAATTSTWLTASETALRATGGAGSVAQKNGDQGAPVLDSSDRLVGVLRLKNTMAKGDDVVASLATLGTGVKVATVPS